MTPELSVFRHRYNRQTVVAACEELIAARRGKMLGDEILTQLDSRHLSEKTFARLCRWVHPRKKESFAQPLAEEICRELYGRTFSRVD